MVVENPRIYWKTVLIVYALTIRASVHRKGYGLPAIERTMSGKQKFALKQMKLSGSGQGFIIDSAAARIVSLSPIVGMLLKTSKPTHLHRIILVNTTDSTRCLGLRHCTLCFRPRTFGG